MYTIYSYWDMAELQAVLNAVVNVMGGSDYLGLLRTFAVVGLFIAIGYGFVRARAEDGGAYLLVLGIWYVGLFVPKVSVVIEDKAPASGAPVNVSNVPLGLAFFATTTSHIGEFLTDRFETMFSLPNDLRFDQNGLMFGSRLLEELRRSSIPDATLNQDITMFVRNCLNPELLNDPGLMNTLVSSTDIWQMLKDGSAIGATMFNPGLAVTLYVPSEGASRWVNCQEAVIGGTGLSAADSLDTRLTASVIAERKRIGPLMNPGLTPATARSVIAGQIIAADALMLGTSRNAQEAIRQNMMINLMRDTSKTIPQLLNDPAAVQIAVGESIAASSSNSSYLVMAKMAEGTLPKIRNIIQLVVLSIFPIVMVLIVMAGTKGGLVLRSYAMAMFWVQLWAPMYAILNYVSTMAAAKSAQGAIGGAGGQSLSNAADLASTVLSDQAIAGIMTISIPIIALALVKGGEVAMSGVVSSVMGPGASTAQRAGDSVGQGNISVGNTSWGTHTANMQSANKSDSNYSHNTGAMSRGAGLGRFNADDRGASSFDGSLLGSSLGKIGGKLSNAVGASAATQATSSWQAGVERANTFSSGLTAAISRAKAFERNSGGATGFSARESSSASVRLAHAGQRMDAIASDISGSTGVERSAAAQLAMQASAAGSAGIGLGDWGVKAEGRLTAAGTKQDTAKNLVAVAQKIASNADYKTAFDDAVQATRDGAKTSDSSSGSRASGSTQAQLQDVVRASDDAAASFRKSAAFDKVSREIASGDRSVDASLASLYVDQNGAGAADSLARGDTLSQATKLQQFADSVAQSEAAAFLSHGGVAQISDAQRAVADRVEAHAPRSAENIPGKSEVRAQHGQNAASVPGSASAAPVDVRPSDLASYDEVKSSAVSQKAAVEGEVSNTRRSLGDAYQTKIDAAQDPTTALGGANSVTSLLATWGLNGMIADPQQSNPALPIPNTPNSWRGKITPAEPTEANPAP